MQKLHSDVLKIFLFVTDEVNDGHWMNGQFNES